MAITVRPKEIRFWRERDITNRLKSDRDWRKQDDRPDIGFSFEEKQP